MDTIRRQDAIDTLDVGAELLRRVLDDVDIVGTEREKYEWGLGLIESCMSDMKELPSAQTEPRWIPCSERLPENGVPGVPVLISHVGFVTEDFLDIDELLGGAFFWNSGISLDEELNNLAWMPLPAPWKGEADGQN